jgi:alpha-L-fucosidase
MYKSLLSFLILFLGNQLFAQLQLPAATPNKAQQALIKRGYGMFIHFGINTFADIEWSDGNIPAQKYNPTQLDPDQWVRVAKEAGFRYVLLTVKHHDGFCLWDSKYTDYDVASSPVKTDVVKAVAAACKKYGLQFAIYYSLWDRHEPTYKDKDPQVYVNYMLQQLTELFTSYGPVCELWLDGGWDRKPDQWGIDKIYALAKKYNPLCAVSVNHTIVNEEGKRKFTSPSDMTEDNKYYFHYFPSDFRLWDPKIINLFDKKQYLHEGKSYYLPFEHTICISKNWNWFQKSTPLPTRGIDELEELFYWTTANDNSLVMNIPPDATGRIREYEANTAIELAKKTGIAANKPLPKNGTFISLLQPVSASNTWPGNNNEYEAAKINDGKMDTRWAAKDTTAQLEMTLNPNKTFNKITIFEYQDVKTAGDGFSQVREPRIKAYHIDIWMNNQWQTIYLSDDPIGDCKVIRLPKKYKTARLRLNITKATAPPSIYEINIIDMPVK